MQIFLGEKAFFKSEMEISTFQDAGHNLNGTHDMAYRKSALIMNYDELNRFTSSLTYSVRRFIFYAIAQRGKGGMGQCPFL